MKESKDGVTPPTTPASQSNDLRGIGSGEVEILNSSRGAAPSPRSRDERHIERWRSVEPDRGYVTVIVDLDAVSTELVTRLLNALDSVQYSLGGGGLVWDRVRVGIEGVGSVDSYVYRQAVSEDGL